MAKRKTVSKRRTKTLRALANAEREVEKALKVLKKVQRQMKAAWPKSR
jgi:hypothetical protein